MITELSIQNFAIIDDISITFHDGLTVLTGETGAGKSIIIDAVQLLTGGRGSVEYVRHGAQKAVISGLFSLEGQDTIYSLADSYDITIDDNMLILERTITKQGKSVCRVNGKIVTLTVLREFGQSVVNIHSQHDTIQLMDRRTHLPLLDLYHAPAINTYMMKYSTLYEEYLSLQKQYDELNYNEQEIAHRLDLLQFQLNELQQANIQENELELLTKERNQLQNFERIYQSVHNAYMALYGEQKGLEWVDIAQSALQDAKDVHPFISKKSEELTSIYYQLEEIHGALRDYADELQYDEARLNQIEARLDELTRLSTKYGSSVEEMIAYKAQITKEINEIEHKDTHLFKLETEIKKVKTEAIQVGEKLHDARQEAAKQLERDITAELSDLYLENATFAVHFEPMSDELYDDGLDKITFQLATNRGEPLKDIHKVASGGELSRVMLALKKIFAKHDNINTVIFDEIDTGVSGRVAQSIAEKMFEISSTTQVLCITHLPQVAAMADQHLLIEKEEATNRTTTRIKELTDKAKINELGKMITGTKLTETAIEHSEELLELTRSFKQSI